MKSRNMFNISMFVVTLLGIGAIVLIAFTEMDTQFKGMLITAVCIITAQIIRWLWGESRLANLKEQAQKVSPHCRFLFEDVWHSGICFSAVVELADIRTIVFSVHKDKVNNKQTYLAWLSCTCRYADGTVHDILADYNMIEDIKIADTNSDGQPRVLLETQWNCNRLSKDYSEKQSIDKITVTSEMLDKLNEQRERLLKSGGSMEVEIVGLHKENIIKASISEEEQI